jgi:DnaJ-class molecular chaperone
MRVSEAYSVLRDPRRRQAYDARLDAGDGLRMQLAEAQAEAGRKADAELGGKTPQGRQYHRLAQKDIARSDYAAAARNLQTALTFEPGNELFKRMLAEAREKL